jgi:hypothetical protein
MNDAKPRRRGRRPGTYVDEDDGDRQSVLGAHSYLLLYRGPAGGRATEGQWLPIGGGVFTWAIATVFLPDIIHSTSPHGPTRELHRDNGTPNQIKSIGVSINWQLITLTRRETHSASRRIICTKNEAGARLDSIQFCRGSPNAQTTE